MSAQAHIAARRTAAAPDHSQEERGSLRSPNQEVRGSLRSPRRHTQKRRLAALAAAKEADLALIIAVTNWKLTPYQRRTKAECNVRTHPAATRTPARRGR